MMQLAARIHPILYRLTKGRFGGNIGGNPILLLSVLGRRSGKLQIVPLAYMLYDGAYVVAASKLGAPKHPAWCLNLRANGHARIEVGDQSFDVRSREAEGEEHQHLWERFLETAPHLDQHQRKTTRTIPLVILRPV